MIEVNRRSKLLVAIAIASFLVSSCSNGFGQSLQRSLSADPQLAENADSLGGLASADNLEDCPPELVEQVSDEFPRFLCYPAASLVLTQPSEAVVNESASAMTLDMTWQTSDARSQVLQFYQSQFEANGWSVINSAANADGAAANAGITDEEDSDVAESEDTLGAAPAEEPEALEIEAENAGDRAVVRILGNEGADNSDEATATDATEFLVEWQSDAIARQSLDSNRSTPIPPGDRSRTDLDSQSDDSTPSASASTATELDRDQRSPSAAGNAQPGQPTDFSDLNQAPEDLKPFVRDLAQLGVLTSATSNNASATRSSEFDPNATISRRTYARWLFNANNTLYGDRPARKIRPATDATQPVFSDVPTTDPDFAEIQGLAEAGLIPSPLSGTSTAVSFRPDAPLTREALLTWKVPLDIRGVLPTATVNAVEETWGFQDANRIDPSALKAVLADYQNGDNANILRAFGYTTLLQPEKTVTRAEAAAVLWYFGYQGDGISARELL